MSSNFYRTLSGEITFWGMWNDAETYIRGASTADLADGADSGMAVYKGMATLPITVPTTEAIDFPGDNGSLGTMNVRPVGPTVAAATNVVQDLAFRVAANGYKIVTEGNKIGVGFSDDPPVFNPMAMIINAPAASNDLATIDNAEWEVTEVLKVTVHDQGGFSFATRAAREWLKNFIFARADTRLSGLALSVLTNGSTTLMFHTYTNPNPIVHHVHIGDGNVGQTVVLDYTPAGITANEVRVTKDGVALTITTDFTVDKATKTLTFTVAGDPSSSETCNIDYDIDRTEWSSV